MVKGDLDYDYFFEVDGERRYDFDAVFGPAELYNFSAPADEDDNSLQSANFEESTVPFQIITANSISICKPQETVSSASSSGSSSCAEAEATAAIAKQGNSPVVSWPAK